MAFAAAGLDPEVRRLVDTARTAAEAAAGLGVDVGQIASSIVFRIERDGAQAPLLVVTSGRHRVDTALVESATGLTLHRADADFVREWSGFAIGGVSPTGWAHGGGQYLPLAFVDTALAEYEHVWAASGHTHVVYRTTFAELVSITQGSALAVARD